MTPEIECPEFVEKNSGDIGRAFGQIANGILAGKSTFLFGAGMSMESMVPDSNGILIKLLDEFFPPGLKQPDDKRKELLIGEYPFEAIVAAIEKILNRKDRLTSILTEMILSDSVRPHVGHSDFVSICYWLGKPLIKKIYTTNFDLLIEKAFGAERAETITAENAEDIDDLVSKGKIPIIHLHGTLDKKYSIIEEDIVKEDRSTIQYDFEADLNRKILVIVGYSMNDPDFRLIYSRYQANLRHRSISKKQTYIVYPAKDYFSYELGKHVWQTRNSIWLPFSATDFFARLKRQLELHAIKDLRSNLKSHRKIDDAALDDLINKVSDALKINTQEALVFLDQTRIVEGE